MLTTVIYVCRDGVIDMSKIKGRNIKCRGRST